MVPAAPSWWFRTEIWDVTDPSKPTKLTTVVDNLTGTHKSWWECDTGIAYLVATNSEEGWRGGNRLKIYDLSDPAKPVYIRDFGMVGTQPNASGASGRRHPRRDFCRAREEPGLHRLWDRQQRGGLDRGPEEAADRVQESAHADGSRVARAASGLHSHVA